MTLGLRGAETLSAATQGDKARLERSFIGFAVRPLYCTLAEIAPPLILCVERIDEVIEMWQQARAAHCGR